MPTHQRIINRQHRTERGSFRPPIHLHHATPRALVAVGGGGGSFVAASRGGEMRRPHGACCSRSTRPAAAFFLAAAAICAHFATGLAADPSKDDNKAEVQSKSHTGQTVLFVLLGIGAAVVLSFFLFKYWQKKKREEQHARLLKLFEEDDDIEMELGLRD